MQPIRAWFRRKLPPTTVDKLRSVRHASSQALTGADMWHLRMDLERRIEERLQQTDAAQDARIMAAVREELTTELDRWGQDMMDRMDILLGATNRLVAAAEDRLAELERRAESTSGNGITPTAKAHPGTAVHDRVAG